MKIQMRRGSTAEWSQQNPVLAAGEIGVEVDTHKFKIGDGITHWADLDYDGLTSGSYVQCRPLLIGDPAAPFVAPETLHAAVLDSKRLVLNGAADPATVGDMDASFGGIVLKGYRDKFWLYDMANESWNTSSNINLSCETGISIDNKRVLDEGKVKVGNRVKGGKLYLGSGEHDSWRLATDASGELVVEYRRLDGVWIEKGRFGLTGVDKGDGLEEAQNPYIERAGEPAKKPAPINAAVNQGKMAWPLYESQDGLLEVQLRLNTDDAFALGRIMKRSVNFNGVLPGPVLKVKPGDSIALEFVNELEDLGEIEPWNDGEMQRHEMVHMHLDDRAYPTEATPMALDTATVWMQHVMLRGMTNLHTHGFHVRPDGFGDNVMRTAKPGSRLRYYYEIPANHFGGLMWFHPHGHGGSHNLIGRGGAGAILIEGPYQQRLNAAQVEREFMILQRIMYGDNINGHDEVNWADYVSNLPLDMYDGAAEPGADGQKVSEVIPLDLSPYYKDNTDPKCICTCAALEGGAPHVHGNYSMATPSCTPVDVKWVPTINGQKKPVFSLKPGELKVFSMLNAASITFYRIGVKDHDIVVIGKDGIPQLPVGEFGDASVDPDFVQNPAGKRLNYVICNPGQRFEFFLVPKAGVTVSGEYPVYMLPVTEVETFDSLDAPVQIGSLSYSAAEVVAETAPNHVSKLVSLLPSAEVDGAAVPQADFSEKQYITTFELLSSLLNGVTTATVEGASLVVEGDGQGNLFGTIVMPNDQPHRLEVGNRIGIGGVDYTIAQLDADLATFKIGVTAGQEPQEGVISFNYDLFKTSVVNNASTGNQDQTVYEVLTEHFFYRGIPLPVQALEPYIVRIRKMSFAIHGRGLIGMGGGSTWMNGSSYNDMNRTVAYLGTNEEIVTSNLSDVIHLYHIHVNPFQVMGYRDGIFGSNAVGAPVAEAYDFSEITVPFQGYEDTVTIPAGVIGETTQVADEADPGSRGEVRMRTKYEDFTGLFLQHCHLLDDQDMGMMQQVEVVAPGYAQAPFAVTHTHG